MKADALIRIVEVAPVGERTSGAFVDFADGSGTFDPNYTFKVYPKNEWSERIRRLRIGNTVDADGQATDGYISLSDFARAIGVKSYVVSGLEQGSYAPEEGEEGWRKLEVFLLAIRAEVTPCSVCGRLLNRTGVRVVSALCDRH